MRVFFGVRDVVCRVGTLGVMNGQMGVVREEYAICAC